MYGTGPRYIARRNTIGRHEFISIYDRQSASWPALHAGVKVPPSFPTEAEAQAWADEHLNP